MAATEEPLGKALLVEVGLSYVEGILPTIDTNDYDKLAALLSGYLSNQKTYEECSPVFQEILGRDDPLIRVKEVIGIPNDPIPYSEEAQALDENPHNRKKTRTWGGYEDQRLVAGVYKYGLDNWPMVATFVGNGRTRAQCAQRWARGLNPRICKKHWSHAEDEQLKQLVQTYGEKAWTKIASAFGNRSDVQCRYHYRQIIKGDELPGSFMSLRRGTPVALSTQAFYNPQYTSMIQPQVYIMPTVPMMAPAPPHQMGLAQMTLQQQAHFATTAGQPAPMTLGAPIPAMRMSMNTLPTSLMNLARNHNGNLMNKPPRQQMQAPTPPQSPTQQMQQMQKLPLQSTTTAPITTNATTTTTTTTTTNTTNATTQSPPAKPKHEFAGIDSFLNHFK